MPKNDDAKKLQAQTAKINAKIVASYEKLAGKFRDKMQKAKEKLESSSKESSRACHRRAFELYGDAAQELEDRIDARRPSEERSGD